MLELDEAIMKALVEDFGDPIEIRKALQRLKLDQKVEYTSGSRGEPVSAFITVHKPIDAPPPHVECWRRTLNAMTLGKDDRAALDSMGMVLQDFDTSEMAALISGLLKLRAEQNAVAGHPSFVVSATYLLGSSKLLSSLDMRCLREFGIDAGLFPSRPPYVVVASAETAEAVILVENPVAFEIAVRSEAIRRCTFVCTFGFGLSNAGNEYGMQLAGAVESGNAILLHRTHGGSNELAKILDHPQVHFWGDLDMAGMQIYERIARRIHGLQLSALYSPMIEAVNASGRRHRYVTAVGKSGQTMFSATRHDVAQMLRYCSEWAVDQEIVAPNAIERLAGKTLAMSIEGM
jgi:hypothetical protein